MVREFCRLGDISHLYVTSIFHLKNTSKMSDILDDNFDLKDSNQPAYDPGPPPKNWQTESIIALILCCWPLALVGLLSASKVNDLWARGEYAAAREAAAKAETWTKWSFGLGFFLIIIVVLLQFAAIASGM